MHASDVSLISTCISQPQFLSFTRPARYSIYNPEFDERYVDAVKMKNNLVDTMAGGFKPVNCDL